MSSWMNIFGMILSLILIVLTERGTNADDVGALMAIKAALIDPKNNLKEWNPAVAHPCKWYEITCDDDNIITRIDLRDYGLSGHLAPQVTTMSNLIYLRLSGNSIGGSIPSQIGNLATLFSLELDHNKFTGPLPASIGNLSRLKHLKLNNNDFSGCVPRHEWRNIIPHLVEFDFSNNPHLCSG